MILVKLTMLAMGCVRYEDMLIAPFAVTLGDEFQGVLKDAQSASLV